MSKEQYPVAILAGGLATRLRPLTEKIPKALLEIEGEPFIYHQLRLLNKQNIKQVTLCLGYLGEMVEDAVKHSDFGLKVHYVYDGDTLLGTGGAIKKALPHLGDNFFVLYGDSYLLCDFASVQKTFEISQKKALMSVYQNENQWDTSNVEFENGKVIVYDKINKSKNMQYIDYGLGIFSADAFKEIKDYPYDLATLYQLLLKQNQLAAYEVQERFYEIGSHSGILEFKHYLTTYRHAQSN